MERFNPTEQELHEQAILHVLEASTSNLQEIAETEATGMFTHAHGKASMELAHMLDIVSELLPAAISAQVRQALTHYQHIEDPFYQDRRERNRPDYLPYTQPPTHAPDSTE